MLNQEKTGKFIAEMRREKHLTQRQLAEQIGVSDKTVSKWENGRSMPDNAILLDVCLILNVSVNELLSGERFTEECYVDKAEENMVELVQESKYHKQKGNCNILGTIFSFLMLVLVCAWVVISSSGTELLSRFVDLPSILIPMGITFFILLASDSLWDFINVFSICYGKEEHHEYQIKNAWAAMKMVLCVIPIAGIFSFIVSLIVITGRLSDVEMISIHVSVALLTMFYSIVMEILLIPTAMKLYRKQR